MPFPPDFLPSLSLNPSFQLQAIKLPADPSVLYNRGLPPLLPCPTPISASDHANSSSAEPPPGDIETTGQQSLEMGSRQETSSLNCSPPFYGLPIPQAGADRLPLPHLQKDCTSVPDPAQQPLPAATSWDQAQLLLLQKHLNSLLKNPMCSSNQGNQSPKQLVSSPTKSYASFFSYMPPPQPPTLPPPG